jgi:hypothetical protein
LIKNTYVVWIRIKIQRTTANIYKTTTSEKHGSLIRIVPVITRFSQYKPAKLRSLQAKSEAGTYSCSKNSVPDPDLLVKGTDSDPDPDPPIIKQKYYRKPLISTV